MYRHSLFKIFSDAFPDDFSQSLFLKKVLRMILRKTSQKGLAFAAILAIFVAQSQVATAVLVHEWKFEDDLLDTSGSGNDGAATVVTFTGSPGSYVEDTTSALTPSYISGAFGGQAINLGVGERVDNTTAASSLPTGATDAFSINLWYNRSAAAESGSYFGGFGNRDNSGQSNRAIYSFGGSGNNNVYFYAHGADVTTLNEFVANGTWHMITVTGTPIPSTADVRVRVYQDAHQIGAATKTFNDAETQLGIGGDILHPSLVGPHAVGGIDEFTVWDHPLSTSEIDSLFATNSISAVPEPNAFFMLTALSMVLMSLTAGRVRQRCPAVAK